MLKKLKATYRNISQGTPGTRFVDHYDKRQREEGEQGAGKATLFLVTGVVLFIVGVALSIPPGVPGFLLWVPALGLVVARWKAFAVFLDRMEVFFRRLFRIHST